MTLYSFCLCLFHIGIGCVLVELFAVKEGEEQQHSRKQIKHYDVYVLQQHKSKDTTSERSTNLLNAVCTSSS